MNNALVWLDLYVGGYEINACNTWQVPDTVPEIFQYVIFGNVAKIAINSS